jgi:hypothetical protein
MEDALKKYAIDFHEQLSQRDFPDIHFAFPDSTFNALDGTDIISAHRNIVVAASPYLRNKIELMTELGLSSATEGSSREAPWLLHDIDKHAFEITVDFMYHPRDLSACGDDKKLDNPLTPAMARAVFKVAQLLLIPILQAMCFKVLAAQLTPTMCLGALHLCLESKGQWAQLEGQGEALFERARQHFAMHTVETVAAGLNIDARQQEGDQNVALMFSLANCDINFFEALFDDSLLKDSTSCRAFFSLLLKWHHLRSPGATAAQLLSWLSPRANEKPRKTFTWSASTQQYSALRSKCSMTSPDFDAYGQTFFLLLTKDDRGTTNTGLYLKPKAAMPGWKFKWTFKIGPSADLPKLKIHFGPYAFEGSSGYGRSSLCPSAHLLSRVQGQETTYATKDIITISVSVASTSLVRVGEAFLTDHFESLVEDKYFSTISDSMIMVVLPLDNLRVSSELDLLRALLKWSSSGNALTEEMLKHIRLSQIGLEELLFVTQGNACLQQSEVCKMHIESIVKKALGPAERVRPGIPQATSSRAADGKPRAHVKTIPAIAVGCREIVSFLMEPPQMREYEAREQELQLKVTQMEFLLNDACNEGMAKEKETRLQTQLQLDSLCLAQKTAKELHLKLAAMEQQLAQVRARGLLLRVGLRARGRLQAREQSRLLKEKAELEEDLQTSREESMRDLRDQEDDHVFKEKLAWNSDPEEAQLGPGSPEDTGEEKKEESTVEAKVEAGKHPKRARGCRGRRGPGGGRGRG